MKRRAGNFIASVFVAATLGTVLAQTTVPCPPYCSEKSLRDNYGLLPESCNGATAPAFAVTQRTVRFR